MPIQVGQRHSYNLRNRISIMRAMIPGSHFEIEDQRNVEVLATLADIKPMSMTETVYSEKLQGVGSFRFTIRFPRVSIEQNDWIECHGVRYEIVAVRNLGGRGIWLEMDCRTSDTASGDTFRG